MRLLRDITESEVLEELTTQGFSITNVRKFIKQDRKLFIHMVILKNFRYLASDCSFVDLHYTFFLGVLTSARSSERFAVLSGQYYDQNAFQSQIQTIGNHLPRNSKHFRHFRQIWPVMLRVKNVMKQTFASNDYFCGLLLKLQN